MKKIYLLILLLLAIALTVLVFTLHPKILNGIYTPPSQTTGAVASFTTPLLHQYKKGVHVYIGEVPVSDTCTAVSAEALVRESYPEQVTIQVETTSLKKDCPQTTEYKKFKVAFQASKEALVDVTVNGKSIFWTSTEASSTVNLEATPLE